MRRWLVFVASLTALSTPRASYGQTDQIDEEIATPHDPPASPPAPANPQRRQWYGWQTLLVDLGAAAAFAAHPAAGLAGYAFAPPVVHAAHRNERSMLMSLGLRVGAPIVGGVAVLGLAKARVLCPNEGPDDDTFRCSTGLFALAFLGGMATAIVVDAAVLSRERERSSPTQRDDRDERSEPPAPAVGVRIAPTLAATRNGLTVGIDGAF